MTEPQPTNFLMEVILGLLAPLLMVGSITDLQLARLAAVQAVDAYNARCDAELVTIGQILGFAVTALDNLRLSMPPDLSLSMKLKLRGNATTLDRANQYNTAHLAKARRADPPLQPSLAEQAAADEREPDIGSAANHREPDPVPAAEPPLLQKPAAPKSASPATDHQNRLAWARVMKIEAAKLQADAAHVSPEKRQTNTLWINVLNGVANDLNQGNYPAAAPGSSRSQLMRSTLMAGDPGFPSHFIGKPKRRR